MSSTHPYIFHTVLETPHFTLEQAPSPGDPHPYFRISGPDSAIVCLANRKSELLVVRQFRPNLGEKTLEFPAGGIEDSEDPASAAEREVLEETGLESRVAQLGCFFRLMMNRTTIRDYLFVGLADSDETPQSREPELESFWISRAELREMSLDGRYQQLAGLGILQLLSARARIDIFQAKPAQFVDAIESLIEA